MGLDVEIKFKLKGKGNAPTPVLSEEEHILVRDDGTGYISTFSRYYEVGYERGPWGHICGILMYLLQHENVETVWYGSDSDDVLPVCTIERVLKLSEHYMRNGHRPYERA